VVLGRRMSLSLQVGALESEGWCLHSVGAEVKRKSVLPPSGCWDSVGVGALS